jgi:hypothetical protein
LRRAPPPALQWEAVRRVQIIAVTGGSERDLIAERIAAQAPGAHWLAGATYTASVALLADASADVVVLGLHPADLVQFGAPFDRCARALICRLDGEKPAAAADDDEWVRAVGLPMLLAGAPVQIDLRDPRLHTLVPYAPFGVVSLHA